MISPRVTCSLLLLALLTACRAPAVDTDAPWSPAELALVRSLSPLPPLPPSPGNRYADDPRAAALGHKLFFDKALSANGSVACATCHEPQRYFTDGLPHAKGIGLAARNAPTILGAQWLPFLFHDGRKDSLWSQALGPLENEVEHGSDRLAIVQHVLARYRPEYEAIFGSLAALDNGARLGPHARPVPFGSADPAHQAWLALSDGDRDGINRVFANVGKALEAYERKLLPREAPLDRYVRALGAGDANGGGALSPAARRGLRAFIGKAQCVSCHNGPLLTDKGFHNIGLPAAPGQSGIDVGRGFGAQQAKLDPFRCGGAYSDTQQCDELRFLNPRFEDFLGAFKTPSLRNVARTAPYMHSGQFSTLAEVLQFYRSLPGKAQVGHREFVLTLLDPGVDSADLLAFLDALTGDLPDARWLVPPT